MNRWVDTTRFTRGKLPHWEVVGGRYFVTVRCADSLPQLVLQRLRELHESIRLIEPSSGQFAALQRQHFRLMEKHLDEGIGACPLREPATADIIVEELLSLKDWEVAAPHYSIMPNHWHAMLCPEPGCPHGLSDIMRRIKGRTARAINLHLGMSGSIWQREWFDRWMRDDAEFAKCAAYIRNNPVKAKLTTCPGEHPWTK